MIMIKAEESQTNLNYHVAEYKSLALNIFDFFPFQYYQPLQTGLINMKGRLNSNLGNNSKSN
jgi:hypothetical protein